MNFNCPCCGTSSFASINFPFCSNCGWEAFTFLADNHREKDFSSRLAIRVEWLKGADKKGDECSTLEHDIKNLSVQIEEKNRQIELTQTEIEQKIQEISQLEDELKKIEQSNIIVDDFHLRNQRADFAKIANLKNPNCSRIEAEIEKDTLNLNIYNFSLYENFHLAIGFSKKPMPNIEEAQIVFRIKLESGDFKSSLYDGSVSQISKPLAIEHLKKGDWYLLISPMQNLATDEREKIRITSLTKMITI